MRWSQMHIPTLREDPADAGAPSHRLLLRAGYIRQAMAGHYSLLPLAVRVRAKVMEIMRQEMNRIGGQEVLLPTMHPAEVWQRSGRWTSWEDVMFRLTDHKGAVSVLAATHEEIFALLAQELNSHRQLPQAWYQFQAKFRDEARPRAGLRFTHIVGCRGGSRAYSRLRFVLHGHVPDGVRRRGSLRLIGAGGC